MFSQSSSGLPSASSSPILMNGEGIYQCSKLPVRSTTTSDSDGHQDMELGEDTEIRTHNADSMATVEQMQAPSAVTTGIKRSCDDGDEAGLKRLKCSAPDRAEKHGTPTNNSVLSSYNSVLALSAEPSKTLVLSADNHVMQQGVNPTPVHFFV